jgi:hypothetical protein
MTSELQARKAVRSLRGPVPLPPGSVTPMLSVPEQYSFPGALPAPLPAPLPIMNRGIPRYLNDQLEHQRVNPVYREQNPALRVTRAQRRLPDPLPPIRSEPSSSNSSMLQTIAGIAAACSSATGCGKPKKCKKCGKVKREKRGGIKVSELFMQGPARAKTFEEAYTRLKSLEKYYTPEEAIIVQKDNFIFNFYDFLLAKHKKPYSDEELKTFDRYVKNLHQMLEKTMINDEGKTFKNKIEYAGDNEKFTDTLMYNFFYK